MPTPSVVFFEEKIKIVNVFLTMSPILPSRKLQLPEMMSTKALMFQLHHLMSNFQQRKKYKIIEWILDDKSFFALSNTPVAANDVY